MATTISFISGKGGVGKSCISATLARLLYILGYKVLLIDLDLVTHGLTYFFIENIKGKKTKGILDIIRESIEPQKDPLQFLDGQKENLILRVESKDMGVMDFIPSKSDILNDSLRVIEKNEKARNIISTAVERIINLYQNEYDFILLDTEAGPENITFKGVEWSDKVVIVTEADPIAKDSCENLVFAFREVLQRKGKDNVIYIMNKVLEGEADLYSDKKFRKELGNISSFPYLYPIPFDSNVRETFMTKDLPGLLLSDFHKLSSPFSFRLIQMGSDLLSQIRGELNKVIEPITKSLWKRKIEQCENKITKLREYLKIWENKKINVKRSPIIANITLCLYLLITGGFFIFHPASNVKIGFLIIFLYVCLLIPNLKNYYLYKEKSLEEEKGKEELDKEIKELEDKKTEYKTLINTEDIGYFVSSKK